MAKISFPTARILWIIFILLIFIVGGTAVFVHSEHLGILDALYLTAQTLSTVGYGDMAPETNEGKILSVILMVAGASVALTAAGILVGFIVEGRLLRHFGARRMIRQIEKLKDHVILCGYGAMGHRVAANLRASGNPFVIVERNGSIAEEAREAGMLVLEGEATQEEVLRQAGLTRAKGLLTAIGDDAENLYIGMTAKMICPKLPIVCRVLSDKAVRHLKRAGIDQVISPEEMGAGRMVQQLLRPEVVDFLDLMLSPGSTGSGLEAYQIPEGCKLIGKELKDSGIREKFGLFVIAMRREGKYIPNPASNEVIQDKDVLILVGTEDAFVKFRDTLAMAS